MIVIPLPIFALTYGYFIPESPIFLSQSEGYTLIDEERINTDSTKTFFNECKQQFIGTLKFLDRRDVRVPMILLLVVIIGQQCSGMKIIQGYAVEIFADSFSHEGQGLKSGERVDSVAYWSAV